VDAVIEGPGVMMIVEELDACSEIEGEVEAGAIEDRNVAGGDEESRVEEGEGLQAMAGCEVDALAERAEAAGVGPAGAAGSSFSHGFSGIRSARIRDGGRLATALYGAALYEERADRRLTGELESDRCRGDGVLNEGEGADFEVVVPVEGVPVNEAAGVGCFEFRETAVVGSAKKDVVGVVAITGGYGDRVVEREGIVLRRLAVKDAGA